MQRSSSETTSSSATTRHPGNLNISSAPGRKGKYLYIERGNVQMAIARFTNERAVELFKEWAKAASGTIIQWEGDGEEGDSEEQT